MERIKNYAKIIQEIIESHSINHAENDTEVITIFDERKPIINNLKYGTVEDPTNDFQSNSFRIVI